METVIERIAAEARETGSISTERVESLLRERCAETHDATRSISKRACMAHYMGIRDERTPFWRSLGIDDDLDQQIIRALRSKPRRTASGVATITVLTKPYPCTSECVYCPNDIRMPKSYLSDEPACQRAERNLFDPYLQVMARLKALHDLGHVTDKVEMIVLGGTFSEYPRPYQRWFVTELFRALNDSGTSQGKERIVRIRERYREVGFGSDSPERAREIASLQRMLDGQELTYNEAWRQAYQGGIHDELAAEETATSDELHRAQRANAQAVHRMVGLVVETRPDLIDFTELMHLRDLGCTKVQLGIQSLDDDVLRRNAREASTQSMQRAFSLLRLFGFKSHVHYMLNLVGSTPDQDVAGYADLMDDPSYKPDEVKLYPCVLVRSAALMGLFERRLWQPYAQEELLECLAACVLLTPPHTRISRMIRDISSTDIVAGNKATNLRQMVDARLVQEDADVLEIRTREVAKRDVAPSSLSMESIDYETSNTRETFLQWVAEDGTLAAFLRLSLPREDAVGQMVLEHPESPIVPGQAMIREVHVYGRVSRLHESAEGTQHLGLGRKLIDEACARARAAGFATIAVISAVGTRVYYERLGFEERGLYHVKEL